MEAVKAMGWLVAAIAVVVAVMLGMQVNRLQRQVDTLEAEAASKQAEISRMRDLVVEIGPEGGPPAPAAPAEAEPVPAEPPVPAPVPVPALPPAPQPVAPPAEAVDEPAALREAPVGEGEASVEQRVARAQIGVIVDMAYRDFYEAAGLTGDRLAQVQQALDEAFSKEAGVRSRAFEDETIPAKQVTAEQFAIRAALREQLAGILSPEELAAYDVRAPHTDRTLYATMLDGQIAMLSTGVSDESRRLAADVMAEELALRLDEFSASDHAYTLDNFNAAQMDALDNALARMQADVDAEQYEALAQFVEVVGGALGSMAGQ